VLSKRASLDDSPSHRLQILSPDRFQLSIVQNNRNNPSPESWRIRVDTVTLCKVRNWLKILPVNSGDDVYDMQTSSPLSIETEVLCIRLRNQDDIEVLIDKVSNRPSITLRIPGCEALIHRVEERDLLLGFQPFMI
jgi:hypothetical protein